MNKKEAVTESAAHYFSSQHNFMGNTIYELCLAVVV